MKRAHLAVWFIVALSSTLASCRKPIVASFGDPFELRVGEAATFPKSDLELRFRRVASDSRCPRNAQCITAGVAFVTLDGRLMKGPAESFDVQLSGADTPDTVLWTPYDGYRIQLVHLVPYPVAGARVDTTAYVATLVVGKR